MRTFSRMLRRQLRKDAVDFIDAFIGEDLIDVSEAALLQRKKIAAGILQIANIVDERHQKVQFRTAPEVIRFLGAGGILDDSVCHGGHKVGIGVQPCKAVPSIRVRHIEEIDRLDIKALLFKVRCCHFKKLALGIRYDYRLRVAAFVVAAALSAAHEEGNDKASRLIRAGGANTEDVVILTRLHAVGDIGGILVWVVRTLFDASEEHSSDLLGGAQFQMLGKLFLLRKARGAMSTVGKNIKAAGVTGKMVSGKPAVTFLGNQTYQQKNHSGDAKTKGRKNDKEVSERVQHPDTLHLLTGSVEYGLSAQLQRVEQHPIKIPPQGSEYGIERNTSFIAFVPASPFICDAVLQLFQEL